MVPFKPGEDSGVEGWAGTVPFQLRREVWGLSRSLSNPGKG